MCSFTQAVRPATGSLAFGEPDDRLQRVSSTPWPLGSIMNVPEYWIARRSLSSGRPKAGPGGGRRQLWVWRARLAMTPPDMPVTLAAQRARGFDESPPQGGRGECRVPSAPAASVCEVVVQHAHEYSQRSHRKSPGIPARNGFNGFLRDLPGDRLSCHRRLQRLDCKLDASVEASGPHDFSVRIRRARLQHHPRPPHPVPTFVTMANAPL